MTIGNKDPAHSVQRALTTLRDEMCARVPVLQPGTESEIKQLGRDHSVLQFNSDDRSCVIDIHGPACACGITHAAFLWNERPLFESQFDDRKLLSRVLSRWVCERAMPSEMRAEFPWLEIDELADYYERGAPIEGEFMRTWDAIEAFYSEDTGDYFQSTRGLIRAMREAGYDRLLRAGQSMAAFGLSRSQGQGLREGQPRLWFDLGAREMDVDANFASGDLQRHPVQLTKELRRLLDALAEYPVD